MTVATVTAVDAVTLEIVRGSLEAMIREMEALIDRTAMSASIKEKKDRFIGLYDRAGNMIAAHLSFSGPGMVKPVLREYPIEEMRPGDLFLFNDPYFTDGAIQHLGDMCFVTPVFSDGRVVAFSAAFGHFRDIGGAKPGSISPSATEIIQEGLRIPPIRIGRDGALNREAYRLMLANSRFPLELEGDTRALMAACGLGETRLVELFGRYGTELVLAAFDELQARTAIAARAKLRELVPEGRYTFYDYVDWDGLDNQPIRVGMELIREGDRITVDISDSGPQTRGPVNFITTHGFVNLLFGRYLGSQDSSFLLNEGLFTVVDELVSREGTVVQPRFPAATGLRSHTRLRLSSCMLGVLNAATGGNAPANSPVYELYTISLRDPLTGKLDVCSEGVGAGLGARPYADGVDVIYFIAQQNFPIEFFEREHAVRVERYEIRADSGGPGRYRGGCGVVRDVRVLAPGVLSTRMDNVRFPCWGASGGVAGRPGAFVLNPGTPRERSVPTIGADVPVEEGDVLRILSVGGGGWGDPFQRPPERVLQDVRQHFVSLDGARTDYGVVIDARTGEIDVEQTSDLRGRSRPPGPRIDRGSATGWLRAKGEFVG
jgi:N-methylhydantoinase B